MIVVRSDDKTNYLTSLHQCDIVVGSIPAIGAVAEIEQITPLVDYLSKCLERALTISIKAAKGDNIEEEDDFAKQLKIIERNSKKEVPQDTHTVTSQDKIDVFNNFHRHLTERLMNALNPAFVFFNTTNLQYFMSKDKDNISGSGFFRLNYKEALNANLPVKEKNVNHAPHLFTECKVDIQNERHTNINKSECTI